LTTGVLDLLDDLVEPVGAPTDDGDGGAAVGE
jgi:hypothetical protein